MLYSPEDGDLALQAGTQFGVQSGGVDLLYGNILAPSAGAGLATHYGEGARADVSTNLPVADQAWAHEISMRSAPAVYVWGLRSMTRVR